VQPAEKREKGEGVVTLTARLHPFLLWRRLRE
jgi:hypothetical protein